MRGRRSAARALWCGVLLLVPIGVAAAIARGVFVADLGARLDPLRDLTLRSLDIVDPLASDRAAETARFDARYAAHPVLALLHVLPGAFFLILAPLQFVGRIRNRHIRFHRWSGRVLMLLACVGTAAALYFGLGTPFGGLGEAVAIAFFAALFLFALGRAYVAIRRHQVAIHREWMIRAFAVAIGISTVRVVMIPLDLALTPAGVGPREVFVISIWTGWLVTLAAAELWIRYTRPWQAFVAAPARAA